MEFSTTEAILGVAQGAIRVYNCEPSFAIDGDSFASWCADTFCLATPLVICVIISNEPSITRMVSSFNNIRMNVRHGESAVYATLRA